MTEEVMSVPLILYFLENWHGNLQSSASICASQTQVVGEKSQLTLLGSHMLAFFFFFGAEQDHTYIEKPGVPVATPAMREEVLLVHVTQSDFFPRRPLMLLLM